MGWKDVARKDLRNIGTFWMDVKKGFKLIGMEEERT